MLTTEQTYNIKQRFKRDQTLGQPLHKSDASPEARKQYINELMKNADFYPTQTKSDEKFEESIRDIIKKLKTFDICLIVAFTVAAGGISGMYKNFTYNKETPATQRIPGISIYALLGALFGLFTSAAITVSNKRIDHEYAVESFYNRMIVRLFDILHKTYPDLDENMLRNCNPEMARVIKTIMVANMSMSDTHKIQKIAKRLYETKYPYDYLSEYEMRDIETGIKQAIDIIENTFVKHPEIKDAVVNAYRGKIPAKFVLEKNQRIK